MGRNNNPQDPQGFENKSSPEQAFDSAKKLAKPATDLLARLIGQKKANPTKSSFFIDQQQNLRRAYLKFAEKKEGINQAYLERLNSIDDYFTAGFISYPQYYAMLNQVIASMEEMDKTSNLSTKEANIRVNEESKKIEDKSADIINEIDPHLKKRLLLIFLIAAPFLPIPYLDFIADPLSQIFDPTQTMGESMSEMVKSESLGQFGKLMDVAQVDELMRLFFDETPILGELFGAVDQIAGSQLVYGSAQLLSPMILESPIVYMAIAGASGIYLTDKELELREKINAITESSQKSIEKLGKELQKNFDEKFGENAKKHGQEMFKAWQKGCMVDEILDLKDFIPSPETNDFKRFFKDIAGANQLKSLKDDDLCPFLFSLDEENFKKFSDKVLMLYHYQEEMIKEKVPVADLQTNSINKILKLHSESIKILADDLNENYQEKFIEKTIEHLIEAKNQEIEIYQEKEKKEQSFFGSKDLFATKQHIIDCQKDIDKLYDLNANSDQVSLKTIQDYYENYSRDRILKNAMHCRVLGDIVPRYCDVGKAKPMRLDEEPKVDQRAELERLRLGDRISWADRVKKEGSAKGGGPDLASLLKGGGRGLGG